jgi:hypothetical protein
MGAVRIASYEGSEITLSMVKWGAVRRSLLFLAKRFRLVNRFSVALFVPRYEIALYEGNPRVVFSKRPFIIFYYPDEVIARAKLEEIVTLVQQGGLLGKPLQEFLRNGAPREQGVMLVEGK